MLREFDYFCMYKSCVLTDDQAALAQLTAIVEKSIQNQEIYTKVQLASKIPWVVIAAIHFRESSQRFDCHLHNGDPLTARTVHWPSGRPRAGEPPFTWWDSAIDALSSAWRPTSWSIGASLQFTERYNGLGYQKAGINSPYVWDQTNQYSGGLFVADGQIDREKRENRPGCAAIFKMFESQGVSLDFTWLG